MTAPVTTASERNGAERPLYDMGELALSRTHSAGIAAAAGDTGFVVTPELAAETGEKDTDAPTHVPYSLARTIGIALVATFAMALSGAGTMSLSIALPRIQKDLNMPTSQLQWVSSAFALTNGCFLLLAGRLADVYGRKVAFIAGVGWHALWCLIGGFMHK